jgi:hypothetical protein
MVRIMQVPIGVRKTYVPNNRGWKMTSGCRLNRYVTGDVRPADSDSCQCVRTNSQCWFCVAGGHKWFCSVVPNICVSAVWNCLMSGNIQICKICRQTRLSVKQLLLKDIFYIAVRYDVKYIF